MKKRRILTLILALILIVSVCGTSVFAESTGDTVTQAESPVVTDMAQVLARIGILELKESYDSNGTVLRADFLTMLLKAIGVEPDMSAERRQIFFDVATDAEIAPMLQTAYELGIIKGRADGRFCPELPITSVEALVMVTRAAGCESIALEEGGYYAGYLVCGKKFGFTEHLAVNDVNSMKNAEAEQMIYNLLCAKTIHITSNGLLLNKNASLLQDLYHITEARGIVDATSVSDIYGAGGCEKGKISINNTLYEIDMEFDGQFLGENVVFYYQTSKKSEEKTIIYLYPEDTETLEVAIENVVSLLPGALKYYNENETLKEISLTADVVTLENGVKVSVPEQGYTLPKYGSIKLIKAEGSKVSMVIMISSKQYGIVKNVNEETLYLESKTSFMFDTGLYETVVVKDGEGNNLSLSEIPRQSLVEVYAAKDKSRIEIVVLNQSKAVTIHKLHEVKKEYPYYKFEDADGTAYRTIRDFKNFYKENKIEVGDTYTALLDSSGYIAAFVRRAGQYRYGYIHKSAEKSGTFDTSAVIRMYTDQGVFEELALADKVENLATNSMVLAKDMLALCTEGQVVKYGVNSKNEISVIDFASTDAKTEGFRKVGTLPEGTSSETVRYRKDTKLFGGVFALGNNTVIFEIPEDSNDEEHFFVLKPEEIVNEGYYPNAQGYADNNSLIANVIVLRSNPQVGRDSARMLITSVAKVYNPESKQQENALIGLVDGKEKTIEVANKDILTCIVKESATAEEQQLTVDAGDVIRFALNHEGKISQIYIAFDYSTRKVYGQRVSGTNYQLANGDMEQPWGKDAIHAYGSITRIQDNMYLRFQWDGATEEKEYAYPVLEGSTYIYIYDSAKRESERAKIATINDIVTLEDNPLITDKAVILTRLGSIPMVVIYK